MTKRWLIFGGLGAGLVAAMISTAALRMRIDALTEPGKRETRIATFMKKRLIRRGSRSGIPEASLDSVEAREEGEKLFGSECAACHGLDGASPTDAGRWMYPRAAKLTSREVQEYSDGELFWIIHNGIRLSGMPAFGKVESDEHIWDLVRYVRLLGKEGQKAGK